MLEYANKITLKGDNIMKFAVITDIHGNFDALQTVLDDIDSRDAVSYTHLTLPTKRIV